MSKVINCPCGEAFRGEDDDEVIAKAQAHVDEDHPDMEMSRSDFLGMVEEE